MCITYIASLFSYCLAEAVVVEIVSWFNWLLHLLKISLLQLLCTHEFSKVISDLIFFQRIEALWNQLRRHKMEWWIAFFKVIFLC